MTSILLKLRTTLGYPTLAYIAIGLWTIFSSGMRQLYCTDLYLAEFICYTCVMLGIPIAMYMDEKQEYRYHKIYAVMSILMVCN